MSQTQTSGFIAALGAKVPESALAGKNGLTYISAAAAVGLAGRPEVHFVDFDGKPHLECFSGSLVAVDLKLPGMELVQRTWLQVMDENNQAKPLASTNLSDINNSRQRALAKAIASVYGNGMSVYLGCDGDGAKAVKMLGVNPDSDLAEATPVVAMLQENGAAFIEWGVGLSVCRITDPAFTWKVLEWNGMPFREVLGSILVDVETVYKGKSQVLSLPVMDAAFNPLPAKKVTVNDWNKAVMRALTKCIAFNTGYGLSVYSTEFGVDGTTAKGKPTSKGTTKKATEKQGTDAATATSTPAADAQQPQAAKVEQAAPAQEVKQPVQDAQPAAQDVKQPVDEPQAETAATPAVDAQQPENAVADATAAVADATTTDVAATDASADTGTSKWPQASADALTRFKKVMHDRRELAGTSGLITLFEALAQSTKFAENDKPGCYVQLLSATAAVVDGKDVEKLLAAIKKYNAMQYLDNATYELVASRVAAATLHHMCDISDEALAKAPKLLMDAGIGMDLKDVLDLATAGNVTKETLDLLKAVLEGATA